MKRLLLILLSFVVVCGCTSESTQPQTEAPELLTGRSAFQKMYISAHGWAADAKPYQLQSQVFGDHTSTDGKAFIWKASFASEAQHSSKPYVWSGVDAQDTPARGVSPGPQDSFAPGNAFDVNFLKIDSDKAYEVAQKHGGDKITGTSITFLLDWAPGENKLVWHVIYGPNRNDAKLVVDVDATTGEFMRKEK